MFISAILSLCAFLHTFSRCCRRRLDIQGDDCYTILSRLESKKRVKRMETTTAGMTWINEIAKSRCKNYNDLIGRSGFSNKTNIAKSWVCFLLQEIIPLILLILLGRRRRKLSHKTISRHWDKGSCKKDNENNRTRATKCKCNKKERSLKYKKNSWQLLFVNCPVFVVTSTKTGHNECMESEEGVIEVRKTIAEKRNGKTYSSEGVSQEGLPKRISQEQKGEEEAKDLSINL